MLTLEEIVFPGKSAMFILEIYIPVALYKLRKILYLEIYSTYAHICIYAVNNNYLKRDHESKREKARVYGRVWNMKGKGKNCNYIIISSIKMGI